MADDASRNVYTELFERLDALTGRGFGTWCAQSFGSEVSYTVNVNWYEVGAQVGKVLASAESSDGGNARDELECFLGDYFTVRRRSTSPEQVLCGGMADEAGFRPRALVGSAAACLLFLEHGSLDPWGAGDSRACGGTRHGGREPDPELLRRQVGMLCLQYAVLENESSLLRGACAQMGSYDRRGGVDPATLAFIDRGNWDAFQPIVRNRNFAKTQRRIGALLGVPGFSESSDAELPLAAPQPGSIPSSPKPANRRTGIEWLKYLAKRSFFTAIEGNITLLAGKAGAAPDRHVDLAHSGWLWKFTQGRTGDAAVRRAPIAANDPVAWQQAGQLLARWIWECSSTTHGETIRATDELTLDLASAIASGGHTMVEFRLLRQAVRCNLGKACWMFNWLQRKRGGDRTTFIDAHADYIVRHYLGPQLAAVLRGIAYGLDLDRAGLGAASVEPGFGGMSIDDSPGIVAMPAGLERTLALEISIAPPSARPVPGSEALWKTIPLDSCRTCRLGRDPHDLGTSGDDDTRTVVLGGNDIGRMAFDLRVTEGGTLDVDVHNPAGIWLGERHLAAGERAGLRPGERIFIPGGDLGYVIVPRWQITA